MAAGDPVIPTDIPAPPGASAPGAGPALPSAADIPPLPVGSTAPTETGLRAPTAFETYREARRRGTEALLSPIPLPGFASAVAEALTPASKAEQGIEIGTLGMGPASKLATRLGYGPAVRLGARYLPAAVGGAGGSMLEAPRDLGRAAWAGAKGVLGGALGDIVGGAVGLYPAIRGRARAEAAQDVTAVGRGIEALTAVYENVRTPQDLDAIAFRGAGRDALDQYRDRLLGSIKQELADLRRREPPADWTAKRQALQGRFAPQSQRAPEGIMSITVPAVRHPQLAGTEGSAAITLDEGVKYLANLSDKGWVKDQLVHGLDATQARALREQVRSQMVAALEERKPGLGERFDRTYNELAKAHLVQDLLQEKGVLVKGKLDMEGLRAALKEKADGVETYSQRIATLTKDDPGAQQALLEAVTRGTRDFTQHDQPFELPIHATIGATGPHTRVGMPTLPERAGGRIPLRFPPGRTPAAELAQRVLPTFQAPPEEGPQP